MSAITNLSSLHAAMAQGNVEALEASMLEQPQVSCGVVHRFGPGIYMREVTIPADTFAIGHHQNFEHMNIMLKGRVSIINDDGDLIELVAPMIFVGKPGRKIGYIHDEMVWMNVYSTHETDVDKLEAHFVTKSDTWELSEANRMLLLGVQNEKKEEEDLCQLPYGNYKVKLATNARGGKSFFATADIAEGEVIAPATISGRPTVKPNYADMPSPNVMLVKRGDDFDIVAILPIYGCKGGRNGDELVIATPVPLIKGDFLCQ